MSVSVAHVELPPEVRSLIQSVRLRLRRYALLSGAFGVIIAAVVAFWVTMGLDSGWFALQRLELPVGLRAALLAMMLAGGLWLLIRDVAQPLLRQLHDRDLALLVERRFPAFQDRLITAVEGAEGLPVNGSLSAQMLTKTVSATVELSQSTEINNVFDDKPLKQRGWIAGLLLLSVAGLGAAAPESIPRWWNAFVRCEPVYHERTTSLDVRVVQQPDDRRIAFRTESGRSVYRHPRGNDLELELSVPEEMSPSGEPWVVPERVRVDVRRSDGSTSRTYVAATSGNLFRYVVTRLQDDLQIDILAGDFRIPQPLFIQSVAPPALDSVVLGCDYPKYTRWNELRETTLAITGSEASLPVGTQFALSACSSKSLQSVRITTDTFDLQGDSEASLLEYRDSNAVVDGPPLLSSDGLMITARFLLDATTQPVDGHFDIEAIRSEDETLIIRPGTALKFSLHDQDNVISTRPLVFRIVGVADRAPVIDTQVDGIDRAVTRRAVIPFVGSIRDDYGLKSAGFEFLVDDESKWRPRPFSSPLSPDVTQYVLGRESDTNLTEGRRPEFFDVQPLDLTEGQTLSLAIVGTDGCEIGDAHVSRGDPVVFRIVSNEELLALLYTREINLRRRFEDVIRELEEVRDDLSFHRQVAKRVEGDGDSAKPEDRAGLTTSATRSGNVLRRQTNELKSIVLGFDSIIQQLINNAVPPAQLSQVMKENIVRPLQRVVNDDLPKADRSVSRFRVAASSRQPVADLIVDAEHEVTNVVVSLKRVLEEVRDMAEFHEVLSDLRAMQEEQKRILQDTKRLKRKQLIDEL